MNSTDKVTVAFFGFVFSFFLLLFAALAWDAWLRSETLKLASDPVAAACAYDSDGRELPTSCTVVMLRDAQVPR